MSEAAGKIGTQEHGPRTGSAEENLNKVTDATHQKYQGELRVVQNIADHFVLPDVEAYFHEDVAYELGVGFAKSPSGVIQFELDEPSVASESYRNAAEAHAVHFAEAFNGSLGKKTKQGVIPIAKDIAYARGNEVHFDLGELHKLLDKNTVADILPKIAEQYSMQYIQEQGEKQIEQQVRQVPQVIQQRQLQKTLVREAGKILDKEEHLHTLKEQDPLLAKNVVSFFNQMQTLAINIINEEKAIANGTAEFEESPTREQVEVSFDEAAIELVDRMITTIKEKQAAAEKAKGSESGLIVVRGYDAQRSFRQLLRDQQNAKEQGEGQSR